MVDRPSELALSPDSPIPDYDSEFINNYTLEGGPLDWRLGAGFYGIVLRARRRGANDEECAVKRIRVNGRQEDLDIALREVRALAVLDHPGIVRFHSSWMETPPAGWQRKMDRELGIYDTTNEDHGDQYLYIQTELCKGDGHGNVDLDRWLGNNSHRPLPQMKSWFKKLVEAVNYLHKNGKIHRDLKPQNILFAGKDIKICDFGLVVDQVIINGEEVDRTRSGRGTALYKAPELIAKHREFFALYSSKVDIFALGLILLELCKCMSTDAKKKVFLKYQEGSSNDGKNADIIAFRREMPQVARVVDWLANFDRNLRPNCEQLLSDRFLA